MNGVLNYNNKVDDVKKIIFEVRLDSLEKIPQT
jgi:hypothetical protein